MISSYLLAVEGLAKQPSARLAEHPVAPVVPEQGGGKLRRVRSPYCPAVTSTTLPLGVHHGDRDDRAETWHRIVFEIPLCINGFKDCTTRTGERRMKRTRLVQRRKTVGLSQEALAEQLGIDVSTVRRWEYGQRIPQPWQRPNLAIALKISVDQLAGLLGEPDAPEVEHREVMAALFAEAWGNV